MRGGMSANGFIFIFLDKIIVQACIDILHTILQIIAKMTLNFIEMGRVETN